MVAGAHVSSSSKLDDIYPSFVFKRHLFLLRRLVTAAVVLQRQILLDIL